MQYTILIYETAATKRRPCAVTGRTDWVAIALLCVSTSAAACPTRAPMVGARRIRLIPPDAVASYQPYWPLSGHLLKRVGRTAEARRTYARWASAMIRPCAISSGIAFDTALESA